MIVFKETFLMKSNMFKQSKSNENGLSQSNLGFQEKYSFINDSMISFSIYEESKVPNGITNSEKVAEYTK